jgi:hypothetical protein
MRLENYIILPILARYPPSDLQNPRSNKTCSSEQIARQSKDYNAKIAALTDINEHARDRDASKRAERHYGITSGVIPSVASSTAELADTDRREADISAASESEEKTK